MSPVEEYAVYVAYACGAAAGVVLVVAEVRNEYRLWRRRRDATKRAEARRERIAVRAAAARTFSHDTKGRWVA
jgi:hypothetical protein